jgi:hypothetical protein
MGHRFHTDVHVSEVVTEGLRRLDLLSPVSYLSIWIATSYRLIVSPAFHVICPSM